MKRVVVTGMGIVSSIGNNTQEVLASLREAKSGIVRAEKYSELGFRCQVHGAPTLDPEAAIDRRAMRFLGGKRIELGHRVFKVAHKLLSAVTGRPGFLE